MPAATKTLCAVWVGRLLARAAWRSAAPAVAWQEAPEARIAFCGGYGPLVARYSGAAADADRSRATVAIREASVWSLDRLKTAARCLARALDRERELRAAGRPKAGEAERPHVLAREDRLAAAAILLHTETATHERTRGRVAESLTHLDL